MNTNAPEKIYVVIDPIWGSMSVNYNRNDAENIEYAHVDAFIEKMARFLENKLYDRVEIRGFGTVIPSLTSKKEFIEEFKNYMKEG